MTMTCGRARRLLWPDAGPRTATSEVEEAREHVSRCELCRRFLEEIRLLGERIQHAAPRPEAPAEVRERLFKAVARARTESPPAGQAPLHRRLIPVIAVAVLLSAVWLGRSLIYDPGRDAGDRFGILAAEHMRTVRSLGVVSTDSAEVAAWLSDRLPFGIDVPMFPDAGLKGARLFVLHQRSGAVIEYAIRGRTLSYYVFPAAEAGEGQIQIASRDGYRIALWEEPGISHALVADLPAAGKT
jgi:anti-sigma factor RsiW